jgi:hypothetical protein
MMADAGLLVDIVEVKRRVGAVEIDLAEDRKEWKEYLARVRKETCAAPDVVDVAVKLMEAKLEARLARVDGKLGATLAQNWILMGGVCAALLKIFGVIP